jgi:hypothetical protein
MNTVNIRSPEEVIRLALEEAAGNPDREEVAKIVAARLAAALQSASTPNAPVVIRPRAERARLEWASIRLTTIEPDCSTEPPPPPSPFPPETKLAELIGLFRAGGNNNRLYMALRRAGIDTLARLLEHEPYELLNCRNFGKRSLTDLRRVLAAEGWYLKGDYAEYQRITREMGR